MPKTVLVADDEPALLRLITRLLEREDFVVVPAADGVQALERLADGATAFDVALVDAGIAPYGAGPILERILADGGRTGTVLMSGSRLEGGTAKLLASCQGRFVGKPFAPEQLVEALRAVAAA